MGRLISLAEYADRNGKSPVTIRQKAQRGMLRTAVKVGKMWMVDEDEPCVDNRRTMKESWDKKEMTVSLMPDSEEVKYSCAFTNGDMLRVLNTVSLEIEKRKP